MHSFRHIVGPLRLFHGPDCLDMLGSELQRLNSRRAVIVCGASLAREGALLELVRTAAGDRLAGVHAGVLAHSPLPAVEAAAQALKQLEADAVIALGGGSSIVTARAASILIAENGNARTLCTSRDASGRLTSPKLVRPKLPQLLIPTTPTTATVKAGSAVLDPVDNKRLALFDPKTRAHSIFIHPAALNSAPRQLVFSAGLNTFTLACEGLLSRSGDPMSDALLMHAVRLLALRLSGVASSDELAGRSDLMLASILCGQGTDHTGAGIAIPLGHAISARFHIDNGISNAIVLPHVLRFNAAAAGAGLAKLALSLAPSGVAGGTALETVINMLEAICSDLGVARRLRDVGVPREALAELAEVSMQDWFVRDNPQPVRDAAELQQVLEDAW